MSVASSELVLVLSRVAKSYRAGVLGCAATAHVLRGLSLKLCAADFATLEGARGSGKTTVMLCAAGMLRPDEGDVRWPGLTQRPGRAPSGIAYAADRTSSYGFLTVRESIAYAATVRELHEPGTARDADELLDLTALTAHAGVRIALLPPADRARLLLAVALVASPKLLLVDDLDGGPDAVGRAAFARCLARIAATGVGVLWAARVIGTIREATAAYVLESGRVRHVGRPATRRARSRAIEIDVPVAAHAAALLARRIQGIERRGGFLRVPLDGASAEEILALCRDLAIPVLGSRVVRDL